MGSHISVNSRSVRRKAISGVPGLKRAEELRGELNDRKVDLMKADLDTAFTFATIARGANDHVKRLRNRKNAREGYDTIVHFRGTATLTKSERNYIDEGILRLKTILSQLGETFAQ